MKICRKYCSIGTAGSIFFYPKVSSNIRRSGKLEVNYQKGKFKQEEVIVFISCKKIHKKKVEDLVYIFVAKMARKPGRNGRKIQQDALQKAKQS